VGWEGSWAKQDYVKEATINLIGGIFLGTLKGSSITTWNKKSSECFKGIN
jgi:hypothetical protein